MPKIIRFETLDIGDILVEVEETNPNGLRNIGDDGDEKAQMKFENALSTVRGVAQKIVHSIINFPERPDEIECKIGIKFNAEAGVIFAKVASEGNLELTLKWTSKKD